MQSNTLIPGTDLDSTSLRAASRDIEYLAGIYGNEGFCLELSNLSTVFSALPFPPLSLGL